MSLFTAQPLCHGWRNPDRRVCRDEWDNHADADQGRRLTIDWTADL